MHQLQPKYSRENRYTLQSSVVIVRPTLLLFSILSYKCIAIVLHGPTASVSRTMISASLPSEQGRHDTTEVLIGVKYG